jgi:uncharacterized membrane protein YhiD involved in acid resistance
VERELRDKAAGLRTLIFICVGATLFTLFSEKLAGDNDPTRILRDRRRVIGLTRSRRSAWGWPEANMPWSSS